MTTKIKILAATALIGLSACNNDDNATPVPYFPADGVIRIVTDPTLLQTRTGSTNGNVTDYKASFLLCIKPKGEIIDSAYIYDNIDMRWTEAGWNAYASVSEQNPFNMLWKNRTTPLEVMAISRKELIVHLTTDGTYKSNVVQDQDKYYGQNDVVFFKGSVNPALLTDVKDAAGNISEYALKDGYVRIPFRHVMSKLNITLTLGTDLNTTPGTTKNPVTELEVLGTNLNLILNTKDGSVTANTIVPKIDSLIPRHNDAAYIPGDGTTTNAVAKYECILVPQTIAANKFVVKIAIGDERYGWCSTTPITLESGKEHSLSINLSNETMEPQKMSALRRGYGGTKSDPTNEPPYTALDGTFVPLSSPWPASDKRQER